MNGNCGILIAVTRIKVERGDNKFCSLKVKHQIMAAVVTRVSTVNSFDNFSIKIPVSNSNCNWLHHKRVLFSEANKQRNGKDMKLSNEL